MSNSKRIDLSSSFDSTYDVCIYSSDEHSDEHIYNNVQYYSKCKISIHPIDCVAGTISSDTPTENLNTSLNTQYVKSKIFINKQKCGKTVFYTIKGTINPSINFIEKTQQCVSSKIAENSCSSYDVIIPASESNKKILFEDHHLDSFDNEINQEEEDNYLDDPNFITRVSSKSSENINNTGVYDNGEIKHVREEDVCDTYQSGNNTEVIQEKPSNSHTVIYKDFES